MRRPVLLAALTVAAALTGAALPHRVERVTPNDNRAPSGVLRDGRLLLRLEARLAMWHPHADDGPGAMMAAFAADDAPPSIPGPLVRVPTGTVIEVTLRNALPDTLRVHGLHDRIAGESDAAESAPVVLAPGAARRVEVRLDVAGTFYYWGTTMRRALNFR